jgi:hypothetical protein
LRLAGYILLPAIPIVGYVAIGRQAEINKSKKAGNEHNAGDDVEYDFHGFFWFITYKPNFKPKSQLSHYQVINYVRLSFW